jgi:hypothetical protein
MKWTTAIFFVWIASWSSSLLAIPAQIIIIRHAEKIPHQKDPSLSQKGKERAAAFIAYFTGDPDVLEFGPPVAIYAQRPSRAFDSLRPIETVQGLAKALNIELNTKYHSNEYMHMLREIMVEPEYTGKMVLICWQRYAIPNMAAALRVVSAPKEWPGSAFDRNWMINFYTREGPSFRNVPQKLMFGDSAK